MELRTLKTFFLVLCMSLGISMIETDAEVLNQTVKNTVTCPKGMEVIPKTGMDSFCYGLFVPSEGPMNYSDSRDLCHQVNGSIIVAFKGKASVLICRLFRTNIDSRTLRSLRCAIPALRRRGINKSQWANLLEMSISCSFLLC